MASSPHDERGGGLAGQGYGLLAGRGEHRFGDIDGVADLSAAEQFRDAVDAGVADVGGGLPAGEDHERAPTVRVHRAFEGGADPDEDGLQPGLAGDAVSDEVGAVAGEDGEFGELPVTRLQDGDVGAHPNGVDDDGGVPGVGLVLPGERGGHVERHRAGHVPNLGAALPEQGKQQRGETRGDVDGPAHRPTDSLDLTDRGPDRGLVVGYAGAVHDLAVGVDRDQVMVGLADVRTNPKLRHCGPFALVSRMRAVRTGWLFTGVPQLLRRR